MSTRYHILRVALASGLLVAAVHAQPPAVPEPPVEIPAPPAPNPVTHAVPITPGADKIPEVDAANEAVEKALEKIVAAKGFDPEKANQEFEILLKPGDTYLKNLRGIKYDPAKGFEPIYTAAYLPEYNGDGPQRPKFLVVPEANVASEIAALKLQVEQLDKKLKESEAVQKTLLDLITSIRKQLPSKPTP